MIKITNNPIIIPSGTFLFAFFTFLDIGIAYSAPINNQKATAVIETIVPILKLGTIGCSTSGQVPTPIIPINPITTKEPTNKNATISCIFANISTPYKFAINIATTMTNVYTKLGTFNPVVSDTEKEKIDASTPQDNVLQTMYPPTIDNNVGNGPNAARVYCANPPVVFGINAFNSDKDAIVVIFSNIAINMAPINNIPNAPAPSPRDTKQLVATTNPTDTETTLPNPVSYTHLTLPTN